MSTSKPSEDKNDTTVRKPIKIDNGLYLDINYDAYEVAQEIDPYLFLGSLDAANNVHFTQSKQIDHLLCIMEELPAGLERFKTRMHLACSDSECVNLRAMFMKTYDYIEKAVEAKENILVHCYAGMSRSATIVLAYLMRKRNWTFDQAYDHVASKRTIWPNPGFRRQLRVFEHELVMGRGQPKPEDPDNLPS